MPTDLAIVSDSHVPGREPEIPAWVRTRLREADHVIHSGDFDAPATVDQFRKLSNGLTAVSGNIDPQTVDLPHVATVDVEAVTFVVVHGTGPHDSWPERVAGVVRETVDKQGDVVGVAGHTHTPSTTTSVGVWVWPATPTTRE